MSKSSNSSKPDTTGQKVGKKDTRFKAGPEWNGNAAGRPKGSRNKLTEDFLSAMAEDFEQHGKAAIVEVRENDPSKYLTVVAQLVPKEAELNINGNDAFVKLWELVASGTVSSLFEASDDEARH